MPRHNVYPLVKNLWMWILNWYARSWLKIPSFKMSKIDHQLAIHNQLTGWYHHWKSDANTAYEGSPVRKRVWSSSLSILAAGLVTFKSFSLSCTHTHACDRQKIRCSTLASFYLTVTVRSTWDKVSTTNLRICMWLPLFPLDSLYLVSSSLRVTS